MSNGMMKKGEIEIEQERIPVLTIPGWNDVLIEGKHKPSLSLLEKMENDVDKERHTLWWIGKSLTLVEIEFLQKAKSE